MSVRSIHCILPSLRCIGGRREERGVWSVAAPCSQGGQRESWGSSEPALPAANQWDQCEAERQRHTEPVQNYSAAHSGRQTNILGLTWPDLTWTWPGAVISPSSPSLSDSLTSGRPAMTGATATFLLVLGLATTSLGEQTVTKRMRERGEVWARCGQGLIFHFNIQIKIFQIFSSENWLTLFAPSQFIILQQELVGGDSLTISLVSISSLH